jgi:hypothetical protein
LCLLSRYAVSGSYGISVDSRKVRDADGVP